MMKKYILLVVFLISTTIYTTKAQWEIVGTAGFTAAGAEHPSLVFNSNNEPYVAFKDGANNSKATVMKFDGNDWVIVGTAGFSTRFATQISLAFNSKNEPYVVYRDDIYATDNKLTVMKFDGDNWVRVGAAEFSGNVQSDHISLAFNSLDEPYVAYTDTTVIDNTVNKATVMKFDGTNWVNVGPAGFTPSAARYVSLAFNNNNDEPFLAYRGVSHKATVMKYNGSNWIPVGNGGFSDAGSDFVSLAFNANNEPFVAYRDAGNSQKATVMKYDGSEWKRIGNAGFSAGVVSYTSLAFNSSNEPYVAYREFVAGSILNQATVMKFDGTNWKHVGVPGFSTGYADQTCLAINQDDVPYVAFSDLTQLYKATVMRFENGGMAIGESSKKSFYIYPNPVENIVYFSEWLKNIEIYSIIGQKLMYYSKKNKIDISTFPSGTYLLKAETISGKITVQKIIKK